MLTELDPSARTALDWVRGRAAPGGTLPAGARVDLHFHPEPDVRGTPVLRSILEQRRYVSQFVTFTSNGGLTAVPGGDRWRWEQGIFNHAYDDADASIRPVYGALNLNDDPYGAAPRFGSAYLRLRPETLRRTTFAYPDSTFRPNQFGVADRLGLLDDFHREDSHRTGGDGSRDVLDHYVEAHVHGGVELPGDVEAVVLDPSFDDETALRLADSIGIGVETHSGYVADVTDIASHPEFRGPEAVDAAGRIAESIAGSSQLRPVDVAEARASSLFDQQQVKQVWHCLARFGRNW